MVEVLQQRPPDGPPDARARVRCPREAHLLDLAILVEHDDPVLACELRGMARHEAGMSPFQPATRPPLWRRLVQRWAPRPGWG